MKVVIALALLFSSGCASGTRAIVHAGVLAGHTERDGTIVAPAVGASAHVKYRRAGLGIGFDYAEEPDTLNAWHVDAQYHHSPTLWFGVGSTSICFSSADCDVAPSFSAAYALRRRAVLAARYFTFDTSNRKDPQTGSAVVVTIGLRTGR